MEKIVYHRGYLFRDRVGNPKLSDDARQWLIAAQAGRGHLVQKRHGPFDYSYIYLCR
tara:strand:+ start:159 stop:329 length:171 start_codon:yes stop_codon:yes gene_type:complete